MLRNSLAQLSWDDLLTILVSLYLRLAWRGLLEAEDLAAINRLMDSLGRDLDEAA